MSIKSLLEATAFGLATAAPGLAAPIDVDFMLGGRTGTFIGLDDADGVSSASSVIYNGLEDSYFFILTDSETNAFTFSAGSLTDIKFSFVGPVIGDEVDGILDTFDCLIGSCTSRERTIPLGQTTIFTSFAPEFTIRPVAPVPLPAGAVLLLSGFVGLAGFRRAPSKFWQDCRTDRVHIVNSQRRNS